MEERRGKPHAIMIAFPYQGHITPFTNLAIKLASSGFIVTFVHTEFVHHMLSQSNHNDSSTRVDFFSDARKSGLDMRYTTISDGFPMEFDRLLNLEEFWESMLRDFPVRVDELVGNIIQSDPSLVHFLIADTFYSWPARIAKKYNLVNVSFWTETSLVFSIAYHLELLKENDHFPPKDNSEDSINYIPGVQSISTKDLMSYCVEAIDTTTPEYRIVFGAFEEVKKADFILHNTVHELESETLLALDQKQPTYAIGPINFYDCTKSTAVADSLFLKSDCTEWLNSKPPGSVLYVSFGSMVQTNKEIIEEIAHGLLISEVNFIWIVRADIVSSNDTDVLPTEFKNDIKDKGLIIPWCNQKEVLSNPAVGGFITHCGWNSILESIWSGVPMICYPVTYDQPTNRKLVVDDWKIGINLCDGLSVTRVEVADKIKSLMSGETSYGLRQEITKMRKILRDAFKIDGSSERYFDQFLKDLKAKILV
ncbi:UDP-glycosyltransferase 86A1 [Forsythia ovata]|uniref:Glycosyltransferase n=1 Tax=Forsythia ovata TaxID=205694 RepID=A0ABD1TNQ4_9LAMI